MTPRGEGVVVTGCSSGIGRATAVLLAQRGFIVFASVRTRKAHEELADLRVRGLVPVSPLDLAARMTFLARSALSGKRSPRGD